MLRLRSISLLPILWICVKSCDVSVTTVSGTLAKKPVCKGQLIFEDNFDKLDLNKWQFELTLGGGGNGEFQWYNSNSTNSYTDKGILHIKPTLLSDQFGEQYLYSGTIDIRKACTNSANNGCLRTGTKDRVLNPVKSARLQTTEKFSFKFGKVEVRAKLPAGDWLWPAIWLLPRYSKYSNWPASGEIDMMESRGNKALKNAGGVNIGVQQIGSTLHWGPNPANNKFMLTHWEKNNNAGYDNDYHLYQLNWTPDNIIFSVDNQEIGRVTPPKGGFWEFGKLGSTGLKNPWTNSKMAPFDQEFFLILNLAVGGTGGFFPDDGSNPKPKPWKNNSPAPMTDFWKAKNDWYPTWNANSDTSHLKVDYVRIWAL